MRSLLLIALLAAPVAAAQERIEPVQPVNPGTGQNTTAQAGVSGSAQLTLDREVEFRLGSLIVRPGVGAGLGARAVAQAGNQGGFRLGSQVFFDAGPQLDVLLPIGARHLWSVSGEARYRWTTQSDTERGQRDQNRWLYTGVGGYQFRATRLTASATYRYSKTETGYLAYQGDGSSPEQDETLVLRDMTQYGPGASVGLEITPRTRLQMQGDYIRQEQEDLTDVEDIPGFGPASELDRDRTTVDAALDRAVTSRTRVGVFVNFRDSGYLNDISRDDTRIRGGLVFSFSGGAAVNSLNGALRVGYESRRFDDPVRENFSGPYAQGNVGWTVDPNVRITFFVRVLSQPTTWADNAYVVQTEGGAIADVALWRTFGIYGGGRYGTLRYPEEAALELPDGSFFTDERLDKRWQVEGGFLFRLFGQPVRLGGGYFERSSNFAFADNTGWFLRANFNAAFGVSQAL